MILLRLLFSHWLMLNEIAIPVRQKCVESSCACRIQTVTTPGTGPPEQDSSMAVTDNREQQCLAPQL